MPSTCKELNDFYYAPWLQSSNGPLGSSVALQSAPVDVLITAELMARCARGEDVVEEAVKVVVGLVVEDRHYIDVSETKRLAVAEVFERIFQVMLEL